MPRSTGRTCHQTFSLSEENAEFIRKYGGAKTTGDGRYNLSQIVEEYITTLRGGGSLEQHATYLQEKKESLRAALEEVEEKAKETLGTTLDDYLATMRANGKASAAAARDRVQDREARKQEFLARLVEHGADKTPAQLRAWLTGPGWKDDLQEHGLTVRDAVRHITEARK